MTGKKWVWIFVGVVLLVMVAGIALVASIAFMVSQRVQVQEVSATTGQEEFQQLRARFAGQKAYLEIADGSDVPVIHRELEKKERANLSTIHLRVFVPDERRVISADLPFWMMRMMGDHPIHFRASEGGFGGLSLSVTAAQIERRGPGLILDQGKPGGEQVLIWTE